MASDGKLKVLSSGGEINVFRILGRPLACRRVSEKDDLSFVGVKLYSPDLQPFLVRDKVSLKLKFAMEAE